MSASLAAGPAAHEHAALAADSPEHAPRAESAAALCDNAAPSHSDAASPSPAPLLHSSSSLEGATSGEVGSRSAFDAFVASVRPGSARLWRSLQRTAAWLEEGLAEFFGLNESKYQWAVVEREYQARQEEERARVAAEREAARQEALASNEMA